MKQSLESILTIALSVPMFGDPNDDDCIWGLPVHMQGHPGVGKCLGRGTPVLKYNGTIVPVEMIKSGDLLMGPDGTPRIVQSTTTGTGPLFKIIPKKGDPWVCNDAHVLTLVTSHGNKVIDIPLNDYLRGTAAFKFERKLFSTGVEFHEGHKERLPIDPYFLGVWYGDGSKTLREVSGEESIAKVTITKPDAEIYQLMADTAEEWGLSVSTYINESGCPSYTLSSGDGRGQPNKRNDLLHTLRAVVGHCQEIPHRYLTASKKDREALLAGLLDTDGHLIHGCYEIVQKRKGLAEGICFLTRSLGMRATMSEKTVEGTVYHRVFISGDATRLPLRIARKRPKARQQVKNVLRTGFSVEAIGNGEYFGFTLNEDGRFLLGDFTVTHNSDRCAEAAKNLGLPFAVIFPATRQPEDISGALIPDGHGGAKQVSMLAAVNEMMEKKTGVIFIDELTGARPSVQGALLGFVLTRLAGDVKLPPKVRILAASNPPESAAGGWDLEPPMANRFAHFDVGTPNAEDWSEWVLSENRVRTHSVLDYEENVKLNWAPSWAKAKGLFTSFLKTQGGLLFKMPASTGGERAKAWPSPRSWTFAMRAVATCEALKVPDDTQLDFVVACVGEGPAVQWNTWRQKVDLPDPIDVILNGFKPDVKRLDRSVAVYTAMAAYITALKDETKRVEYACKGWERLGEAVKADLKDLVMPPASALARANLGMTNPKTKEACSPVLSTLGKSKVSELLRNS